MEHVAIMRSSLGLLEKIKTGRKTVESRWYKTKYPPWGKIQRGDTLYFKDSGKPVNIKTKVNDVEFYSNLTHNEIKKILNEYSGSNQLGLESTSDFFERVKDKKYCILIFFSDVEHITPFNVDKSGYGIMSSWITVNDINNIKVFSSSNVKQHQHLIEKYL
ncbi:MAG: hypothetical protein OEW87_09130 [Flavobacteriaceae bacterium]|nr:hypothetical protein [Flavobacteriaceae bacterium]